MTLSGVDPSAHDLFIGTFFKPALGLWTYVWQLPSSPSDTFSIYPFSFSTCMCVDVHATITRIHMFLSVCMCVETRGVPSVFLGHSPLYLRRWDLLMKMEN